MAAGIDGGTVNVEIARSAELNAQITGGAEVSVDLTPSAEVTVELTAGAEVAIELTEGNTVNVEVRTDRELRFLLKVMLWYRNKALREGNPTEDINRVILQLSKAM